MPVPAWLVHHLLQYMLSTGMPIYPPQYLILSGVTQEANVGTGLSPKGVDLGKSLILSRPCFPYLRKGDVLITLLPVAEEIMKSEGGGN